MPHPLRRRTLALTAGAVLALTVGVLWWTWPRPKELETVRVERGEVTSTIIDLGETRVREPYAITAPATGLLRRIALEPGDRVAAGEVLAWIDPARSTPIDARTRAALQASLKQARAAERRAEAEARRSGEQAMRAASLWDRHLIAKQAYRDAQAQAQAARAALDEARAGIARIEAELADPEGKNAGIAVRAPAAGTVLARHAESARPVNAGELLMDLGDPGALEIVAEFLSQDAARIQPGASAWIEGWGGPAVPARVRKVSPGGRREISALGVEEQRVDVWLDPAEALPGLGHGFQVEARVATARESNVLRVPVESLVRDGATWKVWAVVDGRLQPTVVVPGLSDGRWRMVDGGVAEGDEIVRRPTPTLRTGLAVRPTNPQGL